MKFNYVTCKKCGWVHFQVSRDAAQQEVDAFNIYFKSLSKKDQNDFYGGEGSSLDQYLRCFVCGNSYKNFRKSKYSDCGDGHTCQPIIDRKE